MIVIAKDAFFEPKKIFCENLRQPFFTNDYIPLSCEKSEKINDLIFHKIQKTRFLAVFWLKFAQKIFFSKIGLRHILSFTISHLCAKNQKIPMSQTREKLVTNGRTDERTNERTNERTWVNL